MCQVLFVVPSFESNYFNEFVGTLLLATILKRKDIDVEILRFWEINELDNYPLFLEKITNRINEKKPEIVSLYMRCDTDVIMYNIADKIKRANSGIKIVAGGPQASLTAREIVKVIDNIDFVCKGEGETTIYPLINAILNNLPYEHIPGLVWKDKGQIYENGDPELIADLDENPIVDYSLVPIEYKAKSGSIWDMDMIAIDVGRGCPFGCTYCSTKTFWKRKYRLKSTERIIEEVEAAVKQTGCRNFIFNHDLFTANRIRIVDFCNKMIERNLDIKWTCSSRVDTIDEELILLMKKAGMEKIFFGIETGSVRMQKLINKNINLEKVIPLIRFTGQNRIFTTTSFIYGFPEETEDDIECTLKLMIALAEYSHNFVITHLLAIETGTELFDKYRNQLVFTTKYSDVTEGFGRDENKDFITNNPELFPHFMEYHSELRDRLEYIPHFMGLFSRFFYSMYYMYSYAEKQSALTFYEHFVEVNRGYLVKLSQSRALNDLIDHSEELLVAYIDKYVDCSMSPVISEILKFEMDKFSVQIDGEHVGTIEKVYKFDYWAVIDKSEFSRLDKRYSQILMSMSNTGKIKVMLKKLIERE